MSYDEARAHRSTHIVNDKVVDTTNVVDYKTKNTSTFDFKLQLDTRTSEEKDFSKSIIFDKLGSDLPSHGYTI